MEEHTRTKSDAASNAGSDSGGEDVGAELDQLLAQLWRQIMEEYHPTGCPSTLGLDDNFFEAGGNSLIGMMLVSEIYDQLGIELPFAVLLRAPTIRTLREEILGGAIEGGELARANTSR